MTESSPLIPSITPHGHLVLQEDAQAPPLPAALASRLRTSFAIDAGHGLSDLGSREVGTSLPPAFAFWRDLAGRFISALCTLPAAPEGGAGASAQIQVPVPDAGELQRLAWTAPPMPGAEYLTPEVLGGLWQQLESAVQQELAASGEGLQSFLKSRNQAWNLVGRVHVHLAENRQDPETPFAFLATYTTRLSAQAKPQHQALGQALKDLTGKADQQRLLALLLPLQRAAEQVPWLKQMIDSREVFHPLRWSVAEAMRFLQDVPQLERSGVVVRMPATWRSNRPSRAKVTATVGTQPPSLLGQEALLDFSITIALEGEALTSAETKALLGASQGLVLIRGRWVEVDAERLRTTLAHFQEVQKTAQEQGLGFHAAMRLLAGAGDGGPAAAQAAEVEWAEVVAGPWLAQTLHGLRGPEGLASCDPGKELQATLRPYQQHGLRWLHLLSRLRLGACLADDMGLGKTIQVIALLVVRNRQEGRLASVLVAPASLLGNWTQELERFAPSLKILVAHPSAMPATELKEITAKQLLDIDLVITSYGTLQRLPWLASTTWRHAILDEAQAIKNPGTRQTRAAKALLAHSRIALTGTPIENRIGDLWSIFDFVNPGLLGTAKAFTALSRQLESRPGGFAPIRTLIQPYLLRRLKTDKRVISDLPDKTEMTAFCGLSPAQAALYRQSVAALATALKDSEGIQRRGLVLSYLMRFKQICNHPSHWLGDDRWNEADSGKMARLRELAEVIASKQEKVLVFTQFREATVPLQRFLTGIFAREGLVLHGDTAIGKRKDLVQRFQEDEAVPFFVLSLKAGGSGLNLTAASHVIHFDRWWNPAVENQATDRAFRIGQTRNVLVHKFVCRGTVEEKIDALISSKRELSEELLEGVSSEVNLTEMSDSELMQLVRLDLTAASVDL
jgi:superfamily II DNA or RNA helicase